jgi:hypothetical protein
MKLSGKPWSSPGAALEHARVLYLSWSLVFRVFATRVEFRIVERLCDSRVFVAQRVAKILARYVIYASLVAKISSVGQVWSTII